MSRLRTSERGYLSNYHKPRPYKCEICGGYGFISERGLKQHLSGELHFNQVWKLEKTKEKEGKL